MPFLQKKLLYLTFSSRRNAIYKVPPRIGGHHFLLCQHTNTQDIAGQSASHASAVQTTGTVQGILRGCMNHSLGATSLFEPSEPQSNWC